MLIVENKKVKQGKEEKGPFIYLSDDDYPKEFDRDNDNPMVIIATIHNYAIKRILVYQGSLADILHNAAAASMNIKMFNLRLHDGSLINFLGKLVLVEGLIRLRVPLGTWPTMINMDVDLLIVDTLSTMYNAIIGRASLKKAKTIVSTPHLLMKFPILRGIE